MGMKTGEIDVFQQLGERAIESKMKTTIRCVITVCDDNAFSTFWRTFWSARYHMTIQYEPLINVDSKNKI